MQPDSRLHSVSDDLLRDSRLSSSCVQQGSRLNLVLDDFLRDSRFSSSCVLPDARLDSVLDEFSRDSKPFSSCVQRQFSVDPYPINGSSDLTVTGSGTPELAHLVDHLFHRPSFQIFLRSCKCRD